MLHSNLSVNEKGHLTLCGADTVALAEKYGCVFIDLQKLFADYCSIRHSSYLAWDRIHPNQVGATLVAREFLKHCGFDFAH